MEKINEKVTYNNVLTFWANQYPEVERWLSHLQVKERNALALYNFCKWANKTPLELLALKAQDASVNPPPKTVEKLLDDFVASHAFTDIKTFQGSIAVKSFFKWNYCDLAKAAGAVTYEKVKPYNKLTKEGLRKLWSYALNPRDRALITFVCSTAIAKETLTNLKWLHLEENWENIDLPCINIPSELLKGHGRGKYKGVRQITFLTPEAKRDLMNYKEWLERPQKLNRKLTLQDYMWLETSKPYRRIGYGTFGMLIFTLSRNAGVPFSWHDARRWVNTALEQIGISQNWARKIRGRKVRGEEAPYSQPAIEQLRAKFREAVPLLEFTSETKTETLKERFIVAYHKRHPEATQDEYEKAWAEYQDLQIREGIRLMTEDQFKVLREVQRKLKKRKKEKSIPKPKSKKEPCTNAQHCEETFKQVPETELLTHLKEGWRIVKELKNGEVIISR